MIDEMMRAAAHTADTSRAEIMRRACLYYSDQGDAPLKKTKQGIDDNVLTNYAELIVDKGVSFLFGDELKIEVGAEAKDGETKDTSGEDALEAVWGDDVRSEDLIDMATNGGIFGHVWAQIVVENKIPRVVVLDPLNMSAVWDAHDVKKVRLFRNQYNTFDEQGRAMVCRQDTIREGERWVIVDSESKGAGAWREVKRVDWLYDFPPIFHTKNLPNANMFYGRADLRLGVLRLVYYISRADSLINRILRIHAHPKTIAYGISPQDLKLGTDDVLFLEEYETEIRNLEMQTDLKASMDFRDRLRRSLAEVSHVPEVTTETKSLGTLSGRAMHMLYAPLIDVSKKKRRLYGRMIKELCRALLVIQGKADEAKRIVIHWGDMLPADEKEAVEIAVMKKEIGYSDATLIRQTGGDPDKEKTQRETQVSDFAQARGKAFDAGQGDDVYSTTRGGVGVGAEMDADDLKKRVDAAGALIRAGFDAEGSLSICGLDPVKHLGLLPVTLRAEGALQEATV